MRKVFFYSIYSEKLKKILAVESGPTEEHARKAAKYTAGQWSTRGHPIHGRRIEPLIIKRFNPKKAIDGGGNG